MKFNAYHKIKQFKDVVRNIQFKANFKGMDNDNQPIYEDSLKPKIKFTGTVKLHGTNAGICYFPGEEVKALKRSSLIGLDSLSAHFEFNRFVQSTHKKGIKDLMVQIHSDYACTDREQITLYGEWAGQGVQKGVAISEGPKSFFVFDCKIFNVDTEESRWVDISTLKFEGLGRFFNIYDFPTYELEIDFNNPGASQNALVDITTNVEKECPVGKSFGYEGIGEGVVWTAYWGDEKHIFKVKGEKHSTSKVKKLASVDPELLKSMSEFVEYACTPNRIEQGIQETNATKKKDTPDLLRWIANDIMAEESDVLEANSLEWKQVARDISSKARQYFFQKIDKI